MHHKTRNYYRGCSTVILGVGVALAQIQTTQALARVEIIKTAQNISVLIQGVKNSDDWGSGVIIRRNMQAYTVLTSRHVTEAAKEFNVVTSDGKAYPVKQGSIRSLPGMDLALIEFSSAQSYRIAKIGNSDRSSAGTLSFVAGFAGTISIRSEPSFYFSSGKVVVNEGRSLGDGYALGYNNISLSGMSGGPVLNEKGELIGINGLGNSAAKISRNTQLHKNVPLPNGGLAYAVPINAFLRIVPQIKKSFTFSLYNIPEALDTKAYNYFLQGKEKRKLGDFKGAIADFTEDIRTHPNDALAYSDRGFARDKLGDYQGAIQDYTQAIRLNPNDADAYYNQGLARRKLGDYPGAIQNYVKAIRLNPNDADAYVGRGNARGDSGDYQGAVRDYIQAIRLNPNHALAYYNCGNIRYKSGEEQKAISDFNKAASLAQQQHNQSLYQEIQFLLQRLNLAEAT
jgi:tetratricopeptide (TPR) repeat protein